MHETTLNRLPVAFVEIVAAEFVISGRLREQRIDHAEEAVRPRAGGAFGAPACRQPPILSRERGLLGARRCLPRFYQGGAQPGTAFARAPTAALAGAFIVAWTQSCPRRKVARGREAGEVNPNLRHQHLSGPLAHAGDALEPRHLGLKRADPLRNLGAHT